MVTVTVMPRRAGEWTVRDLDRIPDDGLQYELLDGMLLVTPAPVLAHQRAIGNLHVVLRLACPPGFEVFLSPTDWRPDPRSSLQPDVLVVRPQDRAARNITVPLLLAVEVLSPSTRRKDQMLKRSKYEDSGVASYWMIDPQQPSILALELVDGRYTQVLHATGEQVARLRHPFPVQLVPQALIAPPP